VLCDFFASKFRSSVGFLPCIIVIGSILKSDLNAVVLCDSGKPKANLQIEQSFLVIDGSCLRP
jgi:hypothetical protein